MVSVVAGGLQLDVDMDALEDIEVMDMLYDLQSGETVPPVKKLITAVFGKDQYRKIVDHLKDESGRTSVIAVVRLFEEAMVQANEKKS